MAASSFAELALGGFDRAQHASSRRRAGKISSVDRALDVEPLERIIAKPGFEPPQLFERQVIEGLLLGDTVRDDATNDLVRRTKRNPSLSEMVRKLGRGHESVLERLTQSLSCRNEIDGIIRAVTSRLADHVSRLS